MTHRSSRKSLVLVPACLAFSIQFALANEAPAEASQDAPAIEATNLDQIHVRDARTPYRNLSVTGATKTDALVRDLPQSIHIISSDLLADAGAIDLASALDLSASINRQSNLGGMWDSYSMRGFAGDPNFGSDYMVNGFNASRGYSGVRDNVNVQAVEILKGPSSALYGRGEPGGAVNISTKKPHFKPAYNLELSAGSFDNYRAAVDLTGPLSEKVAYRLSAAQHQGGTSRDHMDIHRTMVTPSFIWMLSPDTTLSYEVEAIKQRQPFDRGVVAVDKKLGVVPISNFYGEPNDGDNQTESTNHQLFLTHYFNDRWSIQTGASYRDSSLKGASTEVRPYSSLVGGQTLRRRIRERTNEALDRSARFEVVGSLDTGGVTHNVLMGVDAYRFRDLRIQYSGDAGGIIYGIDLMNPVYGGAKPAMSLATHTIETQSSWSYYFQDQMDLSEKWKALVGIRRDIYDQEVENIRFGGTVQQDLSATSPRVGLVYQPVPALSLYATTARSFRPNSGTSRDLKSFEPEKGKSLEVGAKLDSFDGRLNTTVALFQITKQNVLRPDPVDPNNFNIAAGEVESKGAELDMNGEIAPGLRMSLSMAYTIAEVTKDISGLSGISLLDTQLANVPRFAGNLLLIKKFTLGGREATFGGGPQYVGERTGSVSPTSEADVFDLPSYTSWSLVGSWQASPKLRLALDVENLLDDEYYVNSYSPYWVYPGTERKVTLSARFSF
jgi:iron complex outermembrane receptor protein